MGFWVSDFLTFPLLSLDVLFPRFPYNLSLSLEVCGSVWGLELSQLLFSDLSIYISKMTTTLMTNAELGWLPSLKGGVGRGRGLVC